QNRNRRAETDQAQPESRVGQLEHEPSLGDVLHPGADVGKEVAGPEEPEVAVAERAGERNPNDRGFGRADGRPISRSSVIHSSVSHATQGQAGGGGGVCARERGRGDEVGGGRSVRVSRGIFSRICGGAGWLWCDRQSSRDPELKEVLSIITTKRRARLYSRDS